MIVDRNDFTVTIGLRWEKGKEKMRERVGVEQMNEMRVEGYDEMGWKEYTLKLQILEGINFSVFSEQGQFR